MSYLGSLAVTLSDQNFYLIDSPKKRNLFQMIRTRKLCAGELRLRIKTRARWRARARTHTHTYVLLKTEDIQNFWILRRSKIHTTNEVEFHQREIYFTI